MSALSQAVSCWNMFHGSFHTRILLSNFEIVATQCDPFTLYIIFFLFLYFFAVSLVSTLALYYTGGFFWTFKWKIMALHFWRRLTHLWCLLWCMNYCPPRYIVLYITPIKILRMVYCTPPPPTPVSFATAEEKTDIEMKKFWKQLWKKREVFFLMSLIMK